jgi:hypothetical protein
MAKAKKNICKPKREKTTGAILEAKIGDLNWNARPVAMKTPGGAKVRKRAPDYITSEIVPGPKGITTTEKCAATKDGVRIKIKKCDTSLQFVGGSSSPKMGVPIGAYLRICTKFGADPIMIPVKNHADAMKKAKKVCGCVSSGETSLKCSKKMRGAVRPKLKRQAKKKASGASEKRECLRWSKNGKRCLRRAKD